ncbi:TPA: FAD-binding protein [Candidatus Poribacteria bacterium]|nr:FAD-binding protein [Candidatus Poribacteria bacterium]
MIKEETITELKNIVGEGNVLTSTLERILYEYDASVDRALPDAVIFPTTTEHVSQIVKTANREKIPFVARGSGTNLSGGSVPIRGGIVIELSKMNQILELDLENFRAVVQPGVFNLDLYNTLAERGYFYAPDPSSQMVATMGGTVGENAGGPHCLKYGVTTNHVMGLEMVLPNGEVIETGGKSLDMPGYDLAGLIVGSEGTFGIVTKIIVRILKMPEEVKTMLAIFESLEDAAQTVSDIIAAGILPATLEMMDKFTIGAVENFAKAGYPLDAEAVLIIELDGLKDGMERLSRRVVQICQKNSARDVRVAKDDAERERLWIGRKSAFGAIAQLGPNYFVCDGVVPRSKLPETLRQVVKIGEDYELRIANVFHAGDGNLHPLILYDERTTDINKVLKAGMEILALCASKDGMVSGEHGVGLEKRDAMRMVYSEDDLNVMKRMKMVFDPDNLANPDKIFPQD